MGIECSCRPGSEGVGMILTKEVLLRKLDELELEFESMRSLVERVKEITRPFEDLDTDTWSEIEWTQERLDQLGAQLAVLRRDVLTDL